MFIKPETIPAEPALFFAEHRTDPTRNIVVGKRSDLAAKRAYHKFGRTPESSEYKTWGWTQVEDGMRPFGLLL